MSKLPEGRTPLTDDQIAGLAGIDHKARADAAEAKLAKAIEELLFAAKDLDEYARYGYGDKYREAVAELTGGKDE